MILQILAAIFSFLLSLWGATTVLLGLVTFICLPFISVLTPFKIFTKLFMGMATFPLRRVAFVISESNEAYFKQLNLELGFLSTNLDDDLKMFEDPAQRMHHWLGLRFGLANEEHGIIFDPRDAAVGMRKRWYDDKDEGEFLATDDEWQEWGITTWKPAVFEMPRNYELVDLSAVKELVDGGERSEYPERVKELYKNSRDPFGGGPPLAKFIYPAVCFSIPFFGIWIMANQLGGSSSTVSFSTALLFGSLGSLFGGSGSDGDDEKGLQDRLQAIDWIPILGAILLVGTPLVAFAILAYLFTVVFAVAVAVAFLIGLLILPILTVLAQVSSIASGALSKLYFKLGFMGFKKPVFVWTPSKYVLKEYEDLDTVAQESMAWYDMFGQIVGFSYEPDPSSWGAEVESHKQLEAELDPKRENAVADGGATDTNVPPKYVRSDYFKRDKYGGFLPKRISDSKYYLNTGIVLNRWANSAIGRKSLRKLLEAKQEYGMDDGVANSMVFKTCVLATFVGAAAGIGIFLLPGLL